MSDPLPHVLFSLLDSGLELVIDEAGTTGRRVRRWPLDLARASAIVADLEAALTTARRAVRSDLVFERVHAGQLRIGDRFSAKSIVEKVEHDRRPGMVVVSIEGSTNVHEMPTDRPVTVDRQLTDPRPHALPDRQVVKARDVEPGDFFVGLELSGVISSVAVRGDRVPVRVRHVEKLPNARVLLSFLSEFGDVVRVGLLESLDVRITRGVPLTADERVLWRQHPKGIVPHPPHFDPAAQGVIVDVYTTREPVNDGNRPPPVVQLSVAQTAAIDWSKMDGDHSAEQAIFADPPGTDAAKWAEQFVEVFGVLGDKLEPELILPWFEGAIAAGRAAGQSERDDALERELETLAEHKRGLQAELQARADRITALEELLAANHGELEKAYGDRDVYAKQLAAMTKERDVANLRAQSAEGLIQTELPSLRAAQAETRREVERLQLEAATFAHVASHGVQGNRTEQDAATIRNLRERNQALEKQYAQMVAWRDLLRDELATLRALYEQLGRDNLENCELLAQFEEKIRDLEALNAAHKRHIQIAQGQLDEAGIEIARLQPYEKRLGNLHGMLLDAGFRGDMDHCVRGAIADRAFREGFEAGRQTRDE